MERLGIGLWGGMPINDLIDVVKLADRRGYESAYLIESFSDAFCFLAACARETDKIILGTGVATVFTRNPTTIAIAAATVDSISEGRFRLGLGAGHREIHRMRDDVEILRPSPFENPLQRLRETTELTRAILKGAFNGESVRYRGEIFQVRDYEPWLSPYRDNIEIFYGAFSESTFELAGEVADGIAPIFVPLEFVPVMKDSVARGAARVGRDPAEIDLGCYLPTCVSDDVEEGKARHQIQHGGPHVVTSVLPKLLRPSRHERRRRRDRRARRGRPRGQGGGPGNRRDGRRCNRVRHPRDVPRKDRHVSAGRHHTADSLPHPPRVPQLPPRREIPRRHHAHRRRSRDELSSRSLPNGGTALPIGGEPFASRRIGGLEQHLELLEFDLHCARDGQFPRPCS